MFIFLAEGVGGHMEMVGILPVVVSDLHKTSQEKSFDLSLDCTFM